MDGFAIEHYSNTCSLRGLSLMVCFDFICEKHSIAAFYEFAYTLRSTVLYQISFIN